MGGKKKASKKKGHQEPEEKEDTSVHDFMKAYKRITRALGIKQCDIIKKNWDAYEEEPDD